MGFFSGDDIVTVNAVTVSLIDSIPNTVAAAGQSAIINNGSIPNYLLLAALGSYSGKARRYLQYGIDDYYLHLPDGTQTNGHVNTTNVTNVIQSIVGQPIVLKTAVITSPQYVFFVYEHLQKQTDFDYFTGEMTVGSVTYRYVDYERVGNQIHINYVNTADNSPKVDKIPKPNNTSFYHAQYRYKTDDATYNRYWTYNPATKVYPVLNLNSTGAKISAFYPIAPLRLEKQNILQQPNSEAAQTTEELLGKFGLSLESLTDSLNESESIEDIDDAFFMLALDLYTQEQDSIHYLFNYFEQVGLGARYSKKDYEKSYNSIVNPKPPVWDPDTGETTYYPVGDLTHNVLSVSESDLDVILQYNYIEKTTHTGNIGAEYTSNWTYKDTLTMYIEDPAANNISGTTRVTIENSYFTLSKQNDDGTYTKLTLHGLIHVSEINAYGEINTVVTRIVTNPEDESKFYIPLASSVLTEFSAFKEEKIILDAMRLVIHAAQEEQLEWYESRFFKGLIFIVSSIMSAYFLISFVNTGLTTAFNNFINQNLTDMAYQILKSVLKSVLTNFVVEYLAEEIGGVLGAIVGAVAGYAIGGFGVEGFSLGELPDAQALLEAVSSVGQGLEAQNTALAEELAEMYDINAGNAAQRAEEIDRANELLNVGTPGKPHLITQSIFQSDPNESPDAFYARTLNQDPGTLTLEGVYTYHDAALQLPQANATDRILFG